MTVPVTAEVLARESHAARQWTCEVRIWRHQNGELGAGVRVTHRGEKVIDLVVADGVARESLSERLELASSAVGAPADVVQGAVAQAWSRADERGWSRDPGQRQSAHETAG